MPNYGYYNAPTTFNDNDTGIHTVDCTCPRCGWQSSCRIFGLKSVATLACPKCMKVGVDAVERNAGAVPEPVGG